MKLAGTIVACLLFPSLCMAVTDDYVASKREACKKRVISDTFYISKTDTENLDVKILKSTSDDYIKCALYHHNLGDNDLFRDASTLYDLISMHKKMDNNSQVNTMSLENLKLELLIKLDELSN